MPLSHRCILDAHMYGPPDIFDESPQETLLQDISMSGSLGAIHQIRFLAMYSIEIFDNLTRLTLDVGDRIQAATLRSEVLMTKIAPLERKVRSTDIVAVSKKKSKVKKFKSKLAIIPSTLTKKTNSIQINHQYSHCNIAPQLWKMETIIADDCVAKYSHPGLFFEEWLKVEILKQEELKKEKKKAKEERKRAKEEKRRKRRAEEDGQEVALSARDRAKARTRQLKEEKRREKERQREEAEENRKRAAAAQLARSPKPPTEPDKRPVSSGSTHKEKMSEIRALVSENYMGDSFDEPPPPDDGFDDEPPPPEDDSFNQPPPDDDSMDGPPPPDESVDGLPPPEDDSFNMPPPDDSFDGPLPPDDSIDDSFNLPPPDDEDSLPPPEEDTVKFPSSPGGSLPPLPEDDLLEDAEDDADELPPPPPASRTPSGNSPDTRLRLLSKTPPAASPRSRPGSPPNTATPPPLPSASASATKANKSAGKSSGRRRSLLDMRVDKGAVAAAAAENLKALNLTPIAHAGDDSDLENDGDDIKSVIAFAQDSASLTSGALSSSHKPFGPGEPPSRPSASSRMSMSGRRSSLGSSSKDVLQQQQRPVSSDMTFENRRLSVNRSSEQDERLSVGTALAMAQTSHDPTDPPDPDAEPWTGRDTYYTEDPPYDQQYDTSQYPPEHPEDYDGQHHHQQGEGEGYDYYGNQQAQYTYDEYGNQLLTDEYGNQYYPDENYPEGGQQQQQGYYDPANLDELPPMEETPVHKRQQSALDISVLGQIKTGRALRRAPPPPPKQKSTRDTVMDLIKDGGVSLRKVEPIEHKSSEQRHEAIAAILSNRAQIAGSDSSDSDSSDSDFSDDSFFD